MRRSPRSRIAGSSSHRWARAWILIRRTRGSSLRAAPARPRAAGRQCSVRWTTPRTSPTTTTTPLRVRHRRAFYAPRRSPPTASQFSCREATCSLLQFSRERRPGMAELVNETRCVCLHGVMTSRVLPREAGRNVRCFLLLRKFASSVVHTSAPSFCRHPWGTAVRPAPGWRISTCRPRKAECMRRKPSGKADRPTSRTASSSRRGASPLGAPIASLRWLPNMWPPLRAKVLFVWRRFRHR